MSDATTSAVTTGRDAGAPPPRVLSIAGTDPTGGAGIQADLKSIAANGGYGMAVVTALVAQNTQGVRSIHVPPTAFLVEQLDAVSDDVEIDAVKIGMLFDEHIVAAVSAWLAAVRPPLVVLDPVMIAASGDSLVSGEAVAAIRALLAEVDLVTPNVPELAALVEAPPASGWDELLEQARRLATDHGVLVVAKGGHLEGPAARDALVAPDGEIVEFTSDRVDTRNSHGTGCSLSSAIATLRVRTGSWPAAVGEAKRWLTAALRDSDSLAVGRGSGPVSHFVGLWDAAGSLGPLGAHVDRVIPGSSAEPASSDGDRNTPGAAEVERAWWASIEPIRTATDELAFVRYLGDGTLDREAFVRYLAQDALYLREYARALAAASLLAPTPEEQAFWAASANGAIAAETELHAGRVGHESLFSAEPFDTTSAYVDHLLAFAARGDYLGLVAAILPCFWMYDDIGRRLAARRRPDHPFGDWLATYDDPAFAASTRSAIEIVTRHAAAVDGEERERMRRAFEVSARHELRFFAAPLQVPSD
ncbi:bifunctional hydroxymethylpyrimidine kinase/phosphomethylpyrimidine kinase [Pseudoclavibacter chungangensis]|uniref:Bifunctional hydroxymethylpyrimidine kinase/phosphomethylpyrimidine kinase n=1 Tax=Pseudoclavibacter chungangensis TaxID=587635 RepID=A0A7J5C2F1_9MICO|nr:bifunctional hydroxymethylpyrimidine kinase/phosphomethylpyrimidine kinase [Pseudoclavibacter chungangensis]KAB1660272.1 bifunctional hydroxymethylpyrimidine kinase/phosphomethylpyrimidine kinase [Pseudoclavibacter chungangensis]NYJ65618.1 hydroxymethylpyrimidine kinase/phosphomethylpyrimidine kinase [Pseudoclavibacter chungangensis]